MNEFRILMGVQKKLDWDFIFEWSLGDTTRKIKFWDTTTKKAIDYREYTPFNKGGLWKVRKFFKFFHVYYGTQKMAYCTSLNSCLDFITNKTQ